MNRSQRNAKAKEKGLRRARRKKKINKIRNTEKKINKIRNTEKKTTFYSNEELNVAGCRGLNLSPSTKYMLNPFIKFNRLSRK